jgi:hypothetical protein
VTLDGGEDWHCKSGVIPEVRSVQAVSLAMRIAASRVSPPPFRQTVRPPKVMQTSQVNFARRGVRRNMAARKAMMKATPSRTGSLRFPVFTLRFVCRASQESRTPNFMPAFSSPRGLGQAKDFRSNGAGRHGAALGSFGATRFASFGRGVTGSSGTAPLGLFGRAVG